MMFGNQKSLKNRIENKVCRGWKMCTFIFILSKKSWIEILKKRTEVLKWKHRATHYFLLPNSSKSLRSQNWKLPVLVTSKETKADAIVRVTAFTNSSRLLTAIDAHFSEDCFSYLLKKFDFQYAGHISINFLLKWVRKSLFYRRRSSNILPNLQHESCATYHYTTIVPMISGCTTWTLPLWIWTLNNNQEN